MIPTILIQGHRRAASSAALILLVVLVGCGPSMVTEQMVRQSSASRVQSDLEGPCGRPGAPKLEGPGVIYFGGGGEDFERGRCVLVEGRVLVDGCQYTDSQRSRGGEGTWVSAQVAEQASTCRALTETGKLREGASPRW